MKTHLQHYLSHLGLVIAFIVSGFSAIGEVSVAMVSAAEGKDDRGTVSEHVVNGDANYLDDFVTVLGSTPTKPAALAADLADPTAGPALLDFLSGNAAGITAVNRVDRLKAWEKLFKDGDAISDVLRKRTDVLEWFAKHGDDIPQSAADDLLTNLNGKTIQNTLEDAQGRLIITTQGGAKRTVATVEKTATGEFKSFKYVNAYNKASPPVSANKLAPDFSSNPGGAWLYPETVNQKNSVRIKLTGKRKNTGGDFHKANQEAGFPGTEAPSGYTWHHLDDFDPVTGEGTFQLVKTSEHVKTFPHTGSVKQYENYHNTTYAN
jgi:hypothetical protein